MAERSDPVHIPPSRLQDFVAHKMQMTLSEEAHIVYCDQCCSALWAYLRSQKLGDVAMNQAQKQKTVH
jgi:RNase P subunit RPR2